MTLTPDATAFVRASLPPPPARLLEVGAGDGRLAALLADAGYDVLAIDPAPQGEHVEAIALLDVPVDRGPFDAAVAMLALHHVEPLAPSCARLGELIRPGGLLVVDELDVDRLDERAARWSIAQRDAAGHEHRAGPAQLVADMRGHLHALAAVRDALSPAFALGEPVRVPFLHRWSVPPGLRDTEEHLIATGALPAVGARLVGIRRGA